MQFSIFDVKIKAFYVPKSHQDNILYLIMKLELLIVSGTRMVNNEQLNAIYWMKGVPALPALSIEHIRTCRKWVAPCWDEFCHAGGECDVCSAITAILWLLDANNDGSLLYSSSFCNTCQPRAIFTAFYIDPISWIEAARPFPGIYSYTLYTLKILLL